MRQSRRFSVTRRPSGRSRSDRPSLCLDLQLYLDLDLPILPESRTVSRTWTLCVSPLWGAGLPFRRSLLTPARSEHAATYLQLLATRSRHPSGCRGRNPRGS